MKILLPLALLISCKIMASECEERCQKEFYQCLNSNCQKTTGILTESYRDIAELLESSVTNKISKTEIENRLQQTQKKVDEVKALFKLTQGCSNNLGTCKTQCPR